MPAKKSDAAQKKAAVRKKLKKKKSRKKASGSVGLLNRNQRRQLEALGEIEER